MYVVSAGNDIVRGLHALAGRAAGADTENVSRTGSLPVLLKLRGKSAARSGGQHGLYVLPDAG